MAGAPLWGFVRRGMPGDWLNHLDQTESRAIDKQRARALQSVHGNVRGRIEAEICQPLARDDSSLPV